MHVPCMLTVEEEYHLRDAENAIRVRLAYIDRPDDFLQVLRTIRTQLHAVGVRHHSLSIQIVNADGTDFISMVNDVSGDDWRKATGKTWGAHTGHPRRYPWVLEAWKTGRAKYQPDLPRKEWGDVRSLIDVPFSHGTLAINSKKQDAFTQRDIEVLRRFAGVLSEGFRHFHEVVVRKRAEEALRESERRFRMLVENAADAFLLFESDGAIIGVNRQACRTLGYTRNELLGMSITDIDVEGHLENLARLPLNRPRTVEGFVRRKNGTTFSVEIRLVKMRLEGREVVLALDRDTSRRKRAEARFQALVETAPDAMVIVNAGGAMTLVNAEAERLFGYARTELIGRPVEMLVPARLCPVHRRHRRAYQKAPVIRGMAPHLDIIALCKDGREFPADIRLSPLETDSEMFVSASIRDISEHKRMEAALRQAHDALEQRVEERTAELQERTAELQAANAGMKDEIAERHRVEAQLRVSERRYRTIVETAGEGMWMTDAKDTTAFVNQQMADMLGYAAEEMLGRSPLAFMDEEAQAMVKARLPLRRQGVGDRYDLPLRRKDGTTLWTMVSATPQFTDDGHYNGVLAMVNDISERRQAEEIVRRARDAADEANRAKSAFLAGVSHELRTPLNGITGMTDLLLDTALSSEQRHYLGSIKHSAEALFKLVSDVLDFSRIEAGALALESTAFSLRECVEGTIAAMSMQAAQQGLELVCAIAPDAPDALTGDAGRLGQVIRNLAGNALKFTKQGEVAVRVDVESQTAEEVRLRFSIMDTGIGIAAGDIEHIFYPFTQVDSSFKRAYQGTGLGLSIASQLIALMGGEIRVDSEPGRGSTFSFSLGFARRPGDVPPDTSLLDGLPVLVAEAHETTRSMLGDLLAHRGMKPTLVDSGEAALEALERASAAGAPFPLALLDSVLPDRSGYETAEGILERSLLAANKLLMLLPPGEFGLSGILADLGVCAFLMKPLKQFELLKTLNAIMMGLPSYMLPAPEEALPRIPERSAHPARILLAEDNAVNQEVVAGLLTRWGHIVVAAWDGVTALEACKHAAERFDLIILDVEMPNMTGIEAAAAIRKHEQTTGSHVPIIALTAHATLEDRDRCLTAGMDAYLSKPVAARRLFDAVERMLSERTSDEIAPVSAAASSGAPFSLERALGAVGGDRALLERAMDIFLEQAPGLMSRVRESIDRGDAPALEKAAHAVKSMVGNFGAQPVFEAARTLERMGKDRDMDVAGAMHAGFEREMDRLRQALQAFRTGDEP